MARDQWFDLLDGRQQPIMVGGGPKTHSVARPGAGKVVQRRKAVVGEGLEEELYALYLTRKSGESYAPMALLVGADSVNRVAEFGDGRTGVLVGTCVRLTDKRGAAKAHVNIDPCPSGFKRAAWNRLLKAIRHAVLVPARSRYRVEIRVTATASVRVLARSEHEAEQMVGEASFGVGLDCDKGEVDDERIYEAPEVLKATAERRRSG